MIIWLFFFVMCVESELNNDLYSVGFFKSEVTIVILSVRRFPAVFHLWNTHWIKAVDNCIDISVTKGRKTKSKLGCKLLIVLLVCNSKNL